MSKTSNKKQLDILLNRMQAYPDIARGMFKGGKEELNRVWRSLEVELNSIGPPLKSIAEWKKVWCDQKKYVRQKAAQNLKNSKGTGGGPNVEYKFSSIEEAIYELIGMKESIEGVGGANKFGLGSYTATSFTEEELNFQELLAGVEDEEKENDVDESHKVAPQPPVKKIKRAHDDLASQVSVGEVFAEELGVQKKVLETIKELTVNSKKNYRPIDAIHKLKTEELEEQKRNNMVMEKLRETEMEEQKRHNMVMEKLRQKEVEDKIEKNRRLLELETLKYDLM